MGEHSEKVKKNLRKVLKHHDDQVAVFARKILTEKKFIKNQNMHRMQETFEKSDET